MSLARRLLIGKRLSSVTASQERLPPTLAERIPGRVRTVTLLAGLAAIPASAQTLSWPRVTPTMYALFGLGALISLSAFGATWATKKPATASLIGRAFIVGYTATAALLDNLVPQPAGAVPIGHAAALVTGLVYVVVVPITPRAASVLLGVVGVVGALTGLFTPWLGGPAPDLLRLRHHLMMTVPYVVASYFIVRTIHELGYAAQQARELGSYRLVERLGHGGMGEVWRAQHRILARPAAVKLVLPSALGVSDGAAGERVLKRFEREARATSELTSPHTVELYDFGVGEDGSFYYVMELLEGLDLRTLVVRHGPLEPARTVALIRQTCASLAEAHALGLVHRDIKPANIMVCRQGLELDFVKVLDFGLVHAERSRGGDDTELTDAQTIVGTPAYLAPELAVGEPFDSRVDIYALGCVAYWLLTGRPVFESERVVDLVIQHARDTPVPPSEVSELDIPPALDDAVLRCLEKNPADRWESVDAFAGALRELDVPEWTSSNADAWWRTHEPDLALRRRDG